MDSSIPGANSKAVALKKVTLDHGSGSGQSKLTAAVALEILADCFCSILLNLQKSGHFVLVIFLFV